MGFQMNQPDFSKRKSFPGTFSGSFDVVLRTADAVERVPVVLFAPLLFGLSLIPFHRSWPQALILWVFFVSDWALLFALPIAGKSFGPAKPPTLLLAFLRLPFAFLPVPWLWIFQGLGTLLVVYGFWIEPHALRVTHQILCSTKLAVGAQLRIMHLTDLHLERITARERQLNRLLHELQPDVILFTGDFLSLSTVDDPKSWADVRALIKEWQAPLGVFISTGSPPVDPPQVLAHLLEGMPNIRCLHGERVSLIRDSLQLDILGLDCSHKPHLDGPQLATMLGANPPSRFTLLMYHSPDLAPVAADLGVDLMLSGHTHGGQVRLPLFGAFYTSSLYGKRFEAGRFALGDTTLYVSRGIGLEGKGAPRVRFLCPPEVVLWKISGTRV
jgi:predicted MPP superfamily phosphohydrolase